MTEYRKLASKADLAVVGLYRGPAGPPGPGVAPFLFATLRSTPPTGTESVQFVSGYNEPGDGGGGQFTWNATDISDDNSGTIAKYSGLSVGRWNRVYNGGLDARWFGATGNGVTDDSAAMVLTDNAAIALNTFIQLSPGTYKGTYTLNSRVHYISGAILNGVITQEEAPLANEGQQIYTDTSVITFGVNALRVLHFIYVNWWGAIANGVFDNWLAINASIISASIACKTIVGGLDTGTGPKLKFGCGLYYAKQPNLTSSGPIWNIPNVQGGLIIEGSGSQQTCIAIENCNSPSAIFRRTNCSQVIFKDLQLCAAGPYGYQFGGSGNAAGLKTITVPTSPFGYPLYSGQPVKFVKFGFWYEDNVIETVGSGTVTLQKPTQYPYAATDYMTVTPFACIEDYSDVTDPGYTGASTNNGVENVVFGSSGILTCLYGRASTCSGGTGSPSDIDNDRHWMRNCVAGNPVLGLLYIGHLNSLENVVNRCSIQGGSMWGIHAPNGGGYHLGSETTISGTIARIGLGGLQSHVSKIIGVISESAPCPFLVANQWVPQCTFTLDDFSQPEPDDSVTVHVISTANWAANGAIIAVGGGGYYSATVVDGTHLSLTNLVASENAPSGTTVKAGTNVGLALKNALLFATQWDDVTSVQVVMVTGGGAASGQKVVPVSSVAPFRKGTATGLSNTDGTNLTRANYVQSIDPVGLTITMRDNLTQTYSAGALAAPSYYLDISGTNNYVKINTCWCSQGVENIPGDLLHMADVVGAHSELSIIQSDLSAVGYVLENAWGNFGARAGFTIGGNPVLQETLIGLAQVSIDDCHQGSALGVAVQPYPPGATRKIPTSIRITVADSPYTAVLDTETVVDTSEGAVEIIFPVIPQWHSCTVKHDETTESLLLHSLTVVAGTNQSLCQPPPNQLSAPEASIVFSTDAASGLRYTWRNVGSNLVSSLQPLVVVSALT